MTSRKRSLENDSVWPPGGLFGPSPGQGQPKRDRVYKLYSHSPASLQAVTLPIASPSPSPLRQSFIPENSLRTTFGPDGSLPLPQLSDRTTSLSRAGSDYSSPMSHITNSSPDEIQHSTPLRVKLALSASSDGRPSVYEDSSEKYQIDDGIILGDALSFVQETRSHEPSLSPLAISNIYSRLGSARTGMTVQTPPSGTSKRSIFRSGTGSSEYASFSSSPPGAPLRKHRYIAPAVNHGSPISRRQRNSVTPEQLAPQLQTLLSESDSEPEIDVIMVDPKDLGSPKLWARRGKKTGWE
ncbi:hypothetical protein L198_04472 [Cryptococcus wingfieldii CBS 7118]|uniref:Uncharacterized protein n=1 Tax=Cryptococcus wingfieldii CBS 7118 TaxID=1295528 RepID=A0A1E3J4T8_9TREE|nr:hypothetical protein L198_04472 [Cryptococcus wingfieldii CBS 7118]ODN95853.1 hypothetical protein L198_04472 [Cryptococcus wingfieldii CBS 7118]